MWLNNFLSFISMVKKTIYSNLKKTDLKAANDKCYK